MDDMLIIIVGLIVAAILASVYWLACMFLGWLADAEKREQQIFEDELDG